MGYVVMPEHVHLLISEPERSNLAVALQMMKQIVSRKANGRNAGNPFWQPRYYDFNVWSERKRAEKLRYIHNNPVKRGLVAKPEEWAWSSSRHYASGEESRRGSICDLSGMAEAMPFPNQFARVASQFNIHLH